MQLRAKLTWITLTVLAMAAEGSAQAQSAPAPTPAGSATAATPARVEPQSPAVGPQLAAARVSLDGKTKKSDAGAAVDWNALANRQAEAVGTVGPGLPLPGSAGAPIPSNAAGGQSLQTLRGDPTGAAPATAGTATRVVPLVDPQPGAASTSAPAPHAESVIRGQVNPAARGCYEKDPAAKSKPAGRLVILIKLAPSGEVDSVLVASDTGLPASVTSCITAAASAARFAAPGANGATVRAAFTFPVPDAQATRDKTGR